MLVVEPSVGGKGQLISKQNCPALTSPKKRTKPTQDTILSAFRSFFGRSFGSTILFWDLLTFTKTGLQNIKSKTKSVVFPAINQAAINWLYVGLKIPLICFLGQKLYVLLWMGIQKLWNKQEYKIWKC